MKFRYYITNLHSGNIEGTDNTAIAENMSTSEDFFVVDTETGLWLSVEESIEIQEVAAFDL